MPALPFIAIFELVTQFTVGATSTIGGLYVSVTALETAFGQLGYVANFGRRAILSGLTIIGSIGGAAGTIYIPDNLYIPPVEHIQEITELALVEYSYAEVFTAETDMPPLLDALYGQELVIVAVGNVTAGFDLTSLNEDSIEFERQDLFTGEYVLQIPEPQLLRCYLDEEKTYVASSRRSAFAPSNMTMDDSLRGFAVDTFSEFALEEGILLHAQERFETVLEQTLSAINFKVDYRVEYVAGDVTSC